jgi:hypothetical protein
MPRTRGMSRSSDAASASGDEPSALLAAAERMVGQIEALVAEMAALRQDNQRLRGELHDAVALMERAGAAFGDGIVPRRRAVAPSANGARRRGRPRVPGRGRRGRATPPEVTSQVIRAAIGKLGVATASQIAAEITRSGAAVNGRAVRFLAEQAGAQISVGDDGQRRYSL